ncbi:MAG: peptidylprolyl isomerase [Bacteroidales bacterium]|nr:peptidylprolyl isomerase [Bacteroidales bacterium]
MKKICLIICSILFLNQFYSVAQSKDVLISIDDNEILKEEFVRIYEKNKTNLSTGEVTSLEEYLDLFINFKLKVFEAEKLGFDTLESFTQEYEGYVKQLARPYLLDSKANEQVVTEAYERMKQEVRASHILIKLAKDATPEDTTAAYEKAIEIRRRIINGEAFDVVAKGSSDDPSVKNNAGDLGYFTVFQMIYPFENVVYNSEIGEISYPVRTRFGYHIVKVTDKRNARGQVKVAHIMIATPRGSTKEIIEEKKKLSNEIYHKLKQGEDFSELAITYSDDKGSARKAGELPWFGVGRMVKEFETAAFGLKFNDEISQPVQTGFGWHIIKRIDRKEVPSFEEAKAEIARKVGKDQRANIARRALIDELKKEYNFKEKTENIPVSFDSIQNIYVLKLKFIERDIVLKDTLFSFLDKVYYEKDFVTYARTKFKNKTSTAYQYKVLYEEYIDEKILELEESRLEIKYPEYKYLLKEYHDGMLLFEITDQKIWSKAIVDSAGLENYYKEHKKAYMWDERWDGSIYKCSNENLFNAVSKITSKSSFGKKVTNDDLLAKFNSESENLTIETGLFTKGDNKIIDKLIWNTNQENVDTKNIAIKGQIIKPKIKTLGEARGGVISDYQDYLDKLWVNKLREQYNIKVNESVLSSIK